MLNANKIIKLKTYKMYFDLMDARVYSYFKGL